MNRIGNPDIKCYGERTRFNSDTGREAQRKSAIARNRNTEKRKQEEAHKMRIKAASPMIEAVLHGFIAYGSLVNEVNANPAIPIEEQPSFSHIKEVTDKELTPMNIRLSELIKAYQFASLFKLKPMERK